MDLSFPWMFPLFSMDLSAPFHGPIRSFSWTYPFLFRDLSAPFHVLIRSIPWTYPLLFMDLSVPFHGPIRSFPLIYPFLFIDLSFPFYGFILSFPWIYLLTIILPMTSIWNYPQTPWRNLFIPHPYNLSINLCINVSTLCIYVSIYLWLMIV